MYKISTIFQLQDSFGDFLKTAIAPEPVMEQRKFGLQLPHYTVPLTIPPIDSENKLWKTIGVVLELLGPEVARWV